jgi:formylglycine-generating enzyme required for sulfatase activity
VRRWLVSALTAVVLGLLSFVVGLKVFTSSKPIEASGEPDGSAAPPLPQLGEPAEGNALRPLRKIDIPALQSQMFAVTKAITAKGDEPAPKKKMVPPVEPKPLPAPEPKRELEPWPPETVAFAGKKPGEEWSANGLKMKLCWCPAGTFTMGSPKDEKDRGLYYRNEDQVEVKLTKGFWLGKYEVTQAEWDRVMGTNLFQQHDIRTGQLRWETENQGYYTEWWDRNQLKWRGARREGLSWEADVGEGPNYPMYYVNHLESSDFCAKLTEQERKAGRLPPGWEYRLPTEAQWEYACRAGTKTATAFGDTLSTRQANFDGNYPYNGAEKGPILRRLQPRGSTGYGKYMGSSFSGYTQPVGSYPANAWGLHDMHGNVAEWCRDWDRGRAPGGVDPEVKFGDVGRIIRGGSWADPGRVCRSAAHKSSLLWSDQVPTTGFRVTLVQLDPKPKPAPEPNPKPLPADVLVNSIGMKLAPIPTGKFIMGSPVDEPGRPWLGRDEIDYEEQHPVTIREPFYMGVYPVTQAAYEQIMGKAPGYEPSYFSREGGGKDKVKGFKDTGQFPRENVSWKDAREFCRRLSELPEEKAAGRRYRLPTEEEWEYACRAGTTTPYSFGKTMSQQQANFSASGPDARLETGNNFGRTTPVGYFNSPNKFGLHDMHGNVSQLCEDGYGPYQAELRNPNNYQGVVVRGGCWASPGILCRAAARGKGYGANMYSGFRVALSVGPAR